MIPPVVKEAVAATTDHAEAFLQRVDQYAQVLPLFWMLILMQNGVRLGQAGKLAGWQINGLPANRRLQRYLARGLAGSLWDFDPNAYADVIFFATD